MSSPYCALSRPAEQSWNTHTQSCSEETKPEMHCRSADNTSQPLLSMETLEANQKELGCSQKGRPGPWNLCIDFTFVPICQDYLLIITKIHNKNTAITLS